MSKSWPILLSIFGLALGFAARVQADEAYDKSKALKGLDLVQLESKMNGPSGVVDFNQADLQSRLEGLTRRLKIGTFAHLRGMPTLRLCVDFLQVAGGKDIAFLSDLELWQNVTAKGGSEMLSASVWAERRLFVVPANMPAKRLMSELSAQLDEFAFDYAKANPVKK